MALLALHISYLANFKPAGGANLCWAVLRMRDRCPSVINPCIYPLTCKFSKFSNKWFWCIIVVLKLFKQSKNWPKNHQFFAGSFMKTVHSIRFFETTGMNNSLILNIFQRTGTVGSLILKFKEPN
jgi:hypothetical protein